MQTRAVALLSRVAVLCDDDTRLQRVVPYILVCHSVHQQPELRFLISQEPIPLQREYAVFQAWLAVVGDTLAGFSAEGSLKKCTVLAGNDAEGRGASKRTVRRAAGTGPSPGHH